MKGSEAQLLDFMEGKDKRYVIPVYQRRYDWKIDNCRQLYNDLKKLVQTKRSSHFFGSIVSQVVPDGSRIEYHIIDGQQRLTTVSLLLLAISNLYDKELIHSDIDDLSGDIKESYIISKRAKEDDRIKLRPVKGDRNAFAKLVAGDEEEYDPTSNLTINYRFFCDQIIKGEITPDDLYDAIKRLQIISITLDKDDDAQLIFESLNSTGLALTEGDKIRNYVLMGLQPKQQDEYYENYWIKIEERAGHDVSDFVRHYLSIKTQSIPTISGVYQAFKSYVEDEQIPLKNLLEDMKKYVRYYQKLKEGKSGLGDAKLNACMRRLNDLGITVQYPFFMEVLRLNEDGKLTTDDVEKIFTITEIYLFRRNICEVPTNALNKIFLNLNREIIKYENNTDNYVEKFVYALQSKSDSGRFPDDEEFKNALANKAVYQMRGKYKAYLFECFENYGTEEVKDVSTLIADGTYTIEHIMPQHLTPEWTRELGDQAEEIHDTWLHRLGNLTLTAYNSDMSDHSFADKRDAKNGYKNSGLRMNQRIATKDHWGLAEIQERNEEMVELAADTIWPSPTTSYIPAQKEFDSCTLDDDDFDLKGREIVRYSYLGVETPVASWADMFEHVIKYLHSQDKSVLTALAYSNSESTDISQYFSNDADQLRSPLQIDENIYAEKNNSTTLKISILQRLFVLFKADPMDLVFYLKDAGQNKSADETRYARRKRYWSFALPQIQEANKERGAFSNNRPGTSNTENGYFGMGGFYVSCVANEDQARVDFVLANKSGEVNNRAFDFLYSRKDEIEQKLGTAVEWCRADKYNSCWFLLRLRNVSILNESDWPRMAKFQAEWSKKFMDVVVPMLKEKTQ